MTRAAGVDPIGTAGSYDGFVLVEHPLPWGREITGEPALADLVAAVENAPGRWRIQGIVPENRDGGPSRPVTVYRRSEPFTAYQRAEGTIESIAGLLDGSKTAVETDAVDVLICTHGRRDVCCGTTGTALWKDLTERLHVLGPGVRLLRTSHTGGHRFAPTAAIFPSGTYWAWLDADLLHRIVHRRGEVSDVLTHYRGSAAMPSPAAQAVEREAFASEGWGWLDSQRAGYDEADGDAATATIEFTRTDGTSGRYHGRVAVERMLPVPVCGEPIEAATKSEPELRVTDLESLS